MSVIIQPGFVGNVQPIDNPRICFDKRAATATATSTASGADAAWIADGETWSVWEGGGTTQTVTLAFSSAITGYAALAAHNLGSTGATVTCQAGGATVGSVSPDDDGAIVFLFANTSVSSVTFSISGGSAAPQIAVAQAGEVLEFPRLANFIGLPISESESISYRHQQSVSGDVLGRAVMGAHLEFQVVIQHLPETFKSAVGDITWAGFKRHIESDGPFFVASKPSSYPDDVAYARCTDQPRFERALPNAAASGAVTLNCIGYRAP